MAVPTVLVRVRFSRLLYALQQRSSETERKTFYYSFAMTREFYAKEIRLFNSGRIFSDWYTSARKRLRTERLKLIRRRSTSELLTQLLAVLALFGSFTFITMDALRGTITLGQLVIAFQAFQRAQASLQGLLSNIASLYEHNLFLNDFYSFLALKSRIQSPPKPRLLPQPMREGIRVEGLSFRYQQSSDYVLKSVDMAIRPGEIVALVGENGAGKTTLIKLLCRLYDPVEGRITIDGIDFRDLDIVHLRRMFTVLFQDFNIYQLTALENIWISNVDKPPDRDRIAKAARASGADDFIRTLPQGYDTQLGNWYTGGRELSFGQWQKIALARAFLRETPVIVLDEPTSALDVMAEHDVFERFRALAAGRSAIIIGHRLSTIRMAHRIYVLDKGCIAESGTHDDLMAADGLYAKLFRTQSKYYR
jgi:ATP-binding cassette subfamily B protein